MVTLIWNSRLQPNHFGFILLLNEQTEKGITVLAGAIDPDCQREIGWLLYNGVKKSKSGIQAIP